MLSLDERVKAQDTTLTAKELINWVNSKPVGNLLERSAWDKRFNEIGLAQNILVLPTANSILYGLEKLGYGNGREGDQVYFYQNLQATDRAILDEMERQKRAGEQQYGGNFFSSRGVMDTMRFLTAAGAVTVVAVGTAGLGTPAIAGVTEGGTLAGSTGLLGGGASATGLTLGTSAVTTATTTGLTLGVSTTVATTGGYTALLAGAQAIGSNYLAEAATGYALNEINNLIKPKNEIKPAINAGVTEQTSNSPLVLIGSILALIAVFI